MQQIIADMRILREQGFKPHLWLECNIDKTTTVYFDGILLYEVWHSGTCRTGEIHMFIQLRSIQDFSLDSLHTLRALNHYLYNTTMWYQTMYRGKTNLLAINIPANYFNIVTSLYRGSGGSIQIKAKATLDVIMARNSSDTQSISVTYKEGLAAFYKRIYNPIKEKKDKIGVTPQGIYYFYPEKVEIPLDFWESLLPFHPTQVEKRELRIILTDPKNHKRVSYRLDEDFYLLSAYCDRVLGLEKILEDFSTLFIASNLAGGSTFYDYPKYTKLYKENFKIEPNRLIEGVDNFMLPTGEILRIDYHTNAEKEISLQEGLLSEKPQLLKNKTTNLELTNDFSVCQQNNIMVINPLYVESISFVDNTLNIGVYCMVRLGTKGFEYMTLPISLLNQTDSTYVRNTILYKMSFCDLTLPYSCIQYLPKDTPIEKVVQKMLPNKLEDVYYERLEGVRL